MRNENTESQAWVAQSVERATKARTVPGSGVGHSFLFGQNLGNCVSCERIGKKDYVITLASAIVKSHWRLQLWLICPFETRKKTKGITCRHFCLTEAKASIQLVKKIMNTFYLWTQDESD